MTFRPGTRRWRRFLPLLLAFGCSWIYVGYAAHACALLEGGSVWCWGYNDRGQLGDGTRYDRAHPAPVVGLPAARSIATGGAFTCASTTDGAAYCWGNGESGQVGDGGMVDRATPAPVPCSTGGEVWCWSDDYMAAPTGLTGAVAVASGRVVSCSPEEPCALRRDGSVSCAELPAAAVAISGGAYSQMCAQLWDGIVSCWGEERFGSPDSNGTDSFGPEQFTSDAVAVSVGHGFACAVLATGNVECWGDNWGGQLGDGTDVGRMTAEPVSGLPGPARAVSAAPGALVTPGGCGESERP